MTTLKDLPADADGLHDVAIAVPNAAPLKPAYGRRDIHRRWRVIGRIVVIVRAGGGAARDSASGKYAKQPGGEGAAAIGLGWRRPDARSGQKRGKARSQALPIERWDKKIHLKASSKLSHLDTGIRNCRVRSGRNDVKPGGKSVLPAPQSLTTSDGALG